MERRHDTSRAHARSGCPRARHRRLPRACARAPRTLATFRQRRSGAWHASFRASPAARRSPPPRPTTGRRRRLGSCSRSRLLAAGRSRHRTQAKALASPAGESLTTRWNVTAPADTAPGSYPLAITATYKWSEESEPASIATDLLAAVVVPPADGVHHLSELAVVNASSALGPVERDMANGAAPEGDGNLLTLGGNVYTRGLGTRAPSEIAYYLGGRCSTLTTDVGIDDELAASGAASFKVLRRRQGRRTKRSRPRRGSAATAQREAHRRKLVTPRDRARRHELRRRASRPIGRDRSSPAGKPPPRRVRSPRSFPSSRAPTASRCPNPRQAGASKPPRLFTRTERAASR